MSTHNLCFGAKIRKIGIPLQILVFLYKSRIQGEYFSWTCFPGPEVIKLFSCSAQPSIQFKLLINTKIAKIY